MDKTKTNNSVYIVQGLYENREYYESDIYYQEVFSTKEKALKAFKEQVLNAKKEIKENYEVEEDEIDAEEHLTNFHAEYEEIYYMIQIKKMKVK